MSGVLLSNFAVNLDEDRKWHQTQKRSKFANELQLYQSESTTALSDVCSSVNTALGINSSRLSGLIQLHQLLQQCDGRLLQDNAGPWFKRVSTIIQSRDSSDTHGMACHVMASLMKHMRTLPEVKHDISSSALVSLMVPLMNADASWINPALHCFCAMLDVFRGPFVHLKSKLDGFIQQQMESDNANTRKLAMRMYSLFPALGGGGTKGEKHVEAWSYHFDKLLYCMHAALDVFFKGMEFDEAPERPKYGLIYWEEKLAPGLQKYIVYGQRLSTVVSGVNYMFKADLDVAVKVPIKSILGVIQRIVAVTPALVLTKQTTERLHQATALHLTYKEALKLINLLTNCVSGHIIPYADMINKCFIQLLAATNTDSVPYGMAKPYGGLRVAVYESLQNWLDVVGASCGIERNGDQLLDLLMADITPQYDTIQQSGDSGALTGLADQLFRRKKKGSKKKTGAINIGEISTQRILATGSNAQFCAAALKALSKLLCASGPLLQAKHYNMLHDLVVPLALSLHTGQPPLPYTDSGCRAAIYGVLESLVVSCHHEVSPPVSCAMTLFTQGCRDSSLMVRQVCRHALTSMQTISHPRAPSLNFPPAAPAPQQQKQNGRVFGDFSSEGRNILKPASFNINSFEVQQQSSSQTQEDEAKASNGKTSTKGNKAANNKSGSMESTENDGNADAIDITMSDDEAKSESEGSSIDSGDLEDADLDLQEVISDVCKEKDGDDEDVQFIKDDNEDDKDSDEVVIIDNPADDKAAKSPQQGSKRPLDTEEEEEPSTKKSCQEASAEGDNSDAEIEQMLADFVDDGPDDD